MSQKKQLTILVIAAVIFIIAAIFSGPTDNDVAGVGKKLFPDLLAHVNDVTSITIQTHDNTLTLVKNQDNWTVKENSGYAADVGKIRSLVLGLSNLKRVEPKTSNVDNYSRIGVQDVTEKDAKSAHITLFSGETSKLADLIIGNSKPSKSGSAVTSYYIRTVSDPKSWLVDGSLPSGWSAKDWLDTNVFEVNRDRIEQVKVMHSDGSQVFIHRDNPDIRDFTLYGLKPGDEINAPFEVNNIATTFTKMTFDNVVAETHLDAGTNPEYSAVLTTFDGLEITFQPFKKDNKYLVKYTAAYNDSIASANRAKQSAKTSTPKDSPAPEQKSNPATKPVTHELATAEQVKSEVDKLNARWQGWLYELPEFRINNIGKSKTDLLKKNPPPAPKADKTSKKK